MQVKVIIDRFNTNVVEYYVVKYVFDVIEMPMTFGSASVSAGCLRFFRLNKTD